MIFQNHLKRSQRRSRIYFFLKSLISSLHQKYIASSLNREFSANTAGKYENKMHNTEYYSQLITHLIALFFKQPNEQSKFQFQYVYVAQSFKSNKTDATDLKYLR